MRANEYKVLGLYFAHALAFGRIHENRGIGKMKIKEFYQLDAVRNECTAIARKKALMSAAASTIPFPGPDFAADVAILFQVIPIINTKFGLSQEQIDVLDPQRKIVILDTIKKYGPLFVGKVITVQLMKTILKRVGMRYGAKTMVARIPLLGSSVAASLGFVVMNHVLNSHIEDCYNVVAKYLGGGGGPLASPVKSSGFWYHG